MNLDTVTEFLRIVSGLFAILGVPLLFNAVKIMKRMDERQAMHHQTLYGVTGTNGLQGDVKVLEEKAEDQATLIRDHGWQIEALEKRL